MEKKQTIWTGQFFLLLLLTFFSGAAGQMTLPLVAQYATEDLGADLTLASTTAGLMSMVSLFVCPFAGVLADRVNRKWILVFSNLGYGLCLIAHAFCGNMTALIICRLFTGLFFSINSVTIVAFSSTFIPRERMGEGLGYVALATIVAQAFGPSIGIWIADNFSNGYAFMFGGISSLCCMAVILFMPYVDIKKDPTERKKVALKDLYAVEFTAFMLMAMLFSGGNGLVSTYLKLIAKEREIANIGVFFTVYSACMVVLRPLTGKLIDKKGVYIIMIPAFIFAGLGMAFVGIGASLGVMLAAAVFKALGQGSGTPSLQAYCVKTLDKSRTGVATSTIMIGQNVGNAVAPIIGSFAVEAYGYEGMFVGAGVIITVVGLALLYVQHLLDKKKAAKA